MNSLIEIENAKVYVGTYQKYNEGSLFGKWLLLSDYDDAEAFYEACQQLHKDEHDPEFMFQDYENIPNGLISEYYINNKLFDVINAVSEMPSDRHEPFLIWLNNGHHDLSTGDIDDLICSFDQQYIGKYDDEEEYAYELVEEREDLSDFAKQYFDYSAYANDLFKGDHWFSEGYVFSN